MASWTGASPSLAVPGSSWQPGVQPVLGRRLLGIGCGKVQTVPLGRNSQRELRLRPNRLICHAEDPYANPYARFTPDAAGYPSQVPLPQQQPVYQPRLGEAARKDLQVATRAVHRYGWASFWVQLTLSLVSAVILLFSVAFTSQSGPRASLYLTLVGILAGFLSTFWNFGYTRLALRMQEYLDAPAGLDVPKIKKPQVIDMVTRGVLINMVGLGATLLGISALVGLLVAKTLSNASSNPFIGAGAGGAGGASPVLALDVFLVQAATNTLLGHFLSLCCALWLLHVMAEGRGLRFQRQLRIRELKEATEGMGTMLPSGMAAISKGNIASYKLGKGFNGGSSSKTGKGGAGGAGTKKGAGKGALLLSPGLAEQFRAALGPFWRNRLNGVSHSRSGPAPVIIDNKPAVLTSAGPVPLASPSEPAAGIQRIRETNHPPPLLAAVAAVASAKAPASGPAPAVAWPSVPLGTSSRSPRRSASSAASWQADELRRNSGQYASSSGSAAAAIGSASGRLFEGWGGTVGSGSAPRQGSTVPTDVNVQLQQQRRSGSRRSTLLGRLTIGARRLWSRAMRGGSNTGSSIGPAAALSSSVARSFDPNKRSLFFPTRDTLRYLDGTLPGDAGFDPLGLYDPATGNAGLLNRSWLRYAEVIHGRWAMLGAVGCLAPEYLQYVGVLPPEQRGVVWFHSGVIPAASQVQYSADAATMLFSHAVLMGFVELRRLQDFRRPGCMGVAPFLGWETGFQGSGDACYPGGWFNAFNFVETQSALRDMKLKEIKHGRLAMVAMVGYAAQAAVTGAGPFQNLLEHVADPLRANVFSSMEHALGQPDTGAPTGAELAARVLRELVESIMTPEGTIDDLLTMPAPDL